ncbi:pneumococcal-type histidine triad protein [Streptococcus suis]
MKQGKTLLYVAGVSLICAVALMTYQVSNYKEQSSHQKITSIETSQSKQSREIPSDPKKEVPGIDKATDDGFLLTDESQIEEKTDLGIIVNHGDHKHFFFYSDLKNTKWSYLIPENYQEKTHSSQPNRNQ